MFLVKLLKLGVLAAALVYSIGLALPQDGSNQQVPKPAVKALLDAADKLTKEQKLVEAVAKYKESLTLAESLQDETGQAMTLQSLGKTFLAVDDPATALDCFEKARLLFAKLGDKVRLASVLVELGSTNAVLERPEMAIAAYTDAIRVQKEVGDESGLAKSNLNIAILFDQTDPAKELEFGEKALDFFIKTGDAQRSVIALIVVGSANGHLGDHEKSVACYTQAAEIAHAGALTMLEGESLAKLGEQFEDVGQYSKALDCFDKSLRIAKNLKSKKSEGMRLTNIGIVSNKIGQRRIAQEYFIQAIDIIKEIGDQQLYASTMQNLGVSFHEEGNDEEAKAWLEKALAIDTEIGDRFGAAGCMGTLGNIARRSQRYEEAVQMLTNAASIFREEGASESEATAMDSLGSVFVDQGKFEAGLGQFDQAIKIYDDLHSDSFAATSYGHKADALFRLNRLTESEKNFREAIGRYEFVRAGLEGLTDAKSSYLKQRVEVYQDFANVLTLLGKADEAFDIAQKTKARGLLDLLASGRLVADSEMSDEERQTEARLKAAADQLNAQMMKEGVDNEVGAKSRYAMLSERLKKSEDELSKFMTELYTRHPGLDKKRVATTATVLEVGMAMPDDTAMIEYVVGEDKVVSLVLRKVNGVLTVKGHSRPLVSSELERRCSGLKKACADPNGDYKDLAIDLYKDLIQPLANDIVGIDRLIVCPDACLWDLPFAVLKPNETGFLLDRYEIDYAYSATGALAALTGQTTKSKATKELLVCANPDFGSSARFKDMSTIAGQRPIDTPSRPIDQPSRPIDQPSRPIDQPSRPIDQPSRPIDQPSRAFDTVSRAIDSVSRGMTADLGRGNAITPLPGTQREADGLSALFPGATVLTGLKAQELQIKKEARDYRYLHFATHGFVNDAAPLLSSIVLAQPDKGTADDGFLTAREVYGLDLHAEMVVLSACNSARGEVRSGEGIVGLTWALFVAGCPCQVVSQWSVDDTSTANLMVDFYKNLSTGSQPKGKALRKATLSLRDVPKYSHPYYWAPFILVGDWH